MNEALDSSPVERTRPRSGRPTRAAALLRDERLLEIATDMFLQSGFDGTSMERLAEAAMIGKATLYARYADKAALFADVLRRRVLATYGPLEEELQTELEGKNLEEALLILARRFLQKAASPDSAALIRIIAAQAERFPELAKLAMQEGSERQTKLVESILDRFSARHRYALDDLTLAADLFLSIVLGRISRATMLGVPIRSETLERRAVEAVRLFVRGLTIDAPNRPEPR